MNLPYLSWKFIEFIKNIYKTMHYTNPVMLLTIHSDTVCCLLIKLYLVSRLRELFQVPRLLERYIQMSDHM